MAEAKALGFSVSTNIPKEEDVTMLSGPPDFVAITGKPCACASAHTKLKDTKFLS